MIDHRLIEAAVRLRDDCDAYADRIVEDGLVDCVYNPLRYAWDIHETYLRMAAIGAAETILLGMNPGPHGMGQMGIPFAATSMVRDVLGISSVPVDQPRRLHPKRPVEGLEWKREEVSGTRLWGLLADKYGDSSRILSKVFLLNHCPLMLLQGERGTNVTPDKISGDTMRDLLLRCDEHLREVVGILGVKRVIGVGAFATKRAKAALLSEDIDIDSCWHPSPASPLANRNGGADWRDNVGAVLPD
jgi:single-strand selective monofunctional uracil DNA glycosylase